MTIETRLRDSGPKGGPGLEIPVPVDKGGTGQVTAQAAADALLDASGKTPGYVWTTDGTNGSWTVATGGLWSSSGDIAYLTTTTNNLVVGNTTQIDSAKFSLHGTSNQKTAVIKATSNQTASIAEAQLYDGTVMFGVNTAGVTIGGTGPGIELPENTSIVINSAGTADGKYSGTTITGVAGYTQAFGDLVTLDKDDSRWEAVDISVAAAATGDARGILGMVVSIGTDGSSCRILLNGVIRADTNFPALTIGAPVYASTTGDITVTQPITTDYVIRIIGYSLTSDQLYFSPGNVWATHT